MTRKSVVTDPRVLVLVAVALAGYVSGVQAQSLVDPVWVAQRVNAQDIVVLHVGTPTGYMEGHLPDAQLITVADVSAQESLLQPDQTPGDADGLRFEIGDVDAIAARLAAFGITNESEIVLYGEPDQPLPSVTRVAFVLSYLGLGENIRFLNGGMNAWLGAGFDVSTATSRNQSTASLRVMPDETMIADSSDVAAVAQTPGDKLIDARVPAYYNGQEASFGSFGHIPGAISLPFNSLVDDDGRFDEAQLTDAFREAGLEQGDTLIVYCHVGMRATQVIFAARLLGFDTRLYDGSFQDWVSNSRGELE